MHYSIDSYVAARLALSASLRLDKQSSFCSAVSAERRALSYSVLHLNLSSLSIILQFSSLISAMCNKKYALDVLPMPVDLDLVPRPGAGRRLNRS